MLAVTDKLVNLFIYLLLYVLSFSVYLTLPAEKTIVFIPKLRPVWIEILSFVL